MIDQEKIFELKNRFALEKIKTLDTGFLKDPMSISIDNENRLFISDYFHCKIFCIDMEGNLLDEFQHGHETIHFTDLEYSPDGRIYCSYFDQGGIGYIENGEVIDYIRVSERCAGIYSAPNGGIYMLHPQEKKMTKVCDGKCVKVIPFQGEDIYFGLIGAVGNRLAVSCSHSGKVFFTDDNGHLEEFATLRDPWMLKFKSIEDSVYFLTLNRGNVTDSHFYKLHLNGELCWRWELKKIGIQSPKVFTVKLVDDQRLIFIAERDGKRIHIMKSS